MEIRVRIEHYRQPSPFQPGHYRRYYRGQGFGKSISVAPTEHGGLTRALVSLPNLELSARAECSVRDSFSYRIGRQIAVGRLRKQLAELGYTINADGIVSKET